jgi:hypothetical protein
LYDSFRSLTDCGVPPAEDDNPGCSGVCCWEAWLDAFEGEGEGREFSPPEPPPPLPSEGAIVVEAVWKDKIAKLYLQYSKSFLVPRHESLKPGFSGLWTRQPFNAIIYRKERL